MDEDAFEIDDDLELRFFAEKIDEAPRHRYLVLENNTVRYVGNNLKAVVSWAVKLKSPVNQVRVVEVLGAVRTTVTKEWGKHEWTAEEDS